MCSIRVAIILIVLMCVNLSTSVASNMPDGKNIDSPSLTTIKDKIDEIEDYINSKPELEKRAQACIATYEKIAQAKNYISSIAELFKNNELTLPIGIKADKKKYTICIEEIYRDVDKSGTVQYVKAICVIPLQGGKNLLAFEGIVQIEGENGIGTHGKLSLVSTNKMALGSQSSLYFCEGSSISFSCGGFDRAHANLMFGINDRDVYRIDDGGNPKGRLTFETEADFSDFDDFTVTLNFKDNIRIKGLDGFTIQLENAVLDQSCVSTPAIVDFPSGYFGGENADADRKTWRGIAIGQAKLVLPKFSSQQTEAASVVGMEHVIIDGFGFTGKAVAQDIVKDGQLKTGEWSMSVTGFSLSLLKGKIDGAGFSGKINVPPFGANSLLNYEATYIQSEKAFKIKADLGGNRDFPLFCGNLSFDKTSSIEVELRDGSVYPTILANGTLSVVAPIGKDTANTKLVLPDLRFENLRISRDAPVFDIGRIALSNNKETSEMTGFKLVLNDINTVHDSDGSGVYVNASVCLTDQFTGTAGLNLYGDADRWKFRKVKVGSINVAYNTPAYSINGGVEFKDGDEIYGKGFRGDLEFKLIDKFTLNAVGVFGKKDGFKYFLTDVFYETNPTGGLTIPPALNFYGVGGGLYNHMKQTFGGQTTDFGKSLTGINYVPNQDAGMGFMARTKFNLFKNSALLDADVTFEMQFTKDWGLEFIQLRGEATMISAEAQQELLNGIKQKIDKVKSATGGIVQFDDSELARKPEKDGALTSTIGIKYDIDNDVFTAKMNSFLDVAGVVTGRNANNQMGMADAYFSKDKWYTYIGTSKERLGISLLGIADAGGYFMIGSDVPELTLPEKMVGKIPSNMFGDAKSRKEGSRLTSGSGMAFGADLSVNFDATLPPFYASLGVGMGTEMLLKKYSTMAHCSGMQGPIGINGWYAQAQAWAWVDAAIGMRLNLFHKERKFEIIKAAMAAYLAGAGPNPFYFAGAVGGEFRLLGGLVKGKCNFDFTVGEKCDIEGGSPFGEDVIAQLTPMDKSEGVNVFLAPQLILNVPADDEMTIEDEQGRKDIYRVTVAEFWIKNMHTGKNVSFKKSVEKERRVLTYDPEEPFESQQNYNIYAKVAFERKDGNKWVPVYGDDAKPYYEDKLVEFKSGDRPNYIMQEHVKYAYPADRQYNFLSKEYNQAYVMVSENYSYLFAADRTKDYDQKVQFTPFEGATQTSSFSYKSVSGVDGVVFEIDIPTDKINLSQNTIYNMAIINVPKRKMAADANIITKDKDMAKSKPNKDTEVTESKHEAEGNLEMLEQTEIYAVDFRTSSYKTFREKMGSFDVGNAVLWQEYVPVYNLVSNIENNRYNGEMFDNCEYDYYNLNNNLVSFEPDYNNTEYYNKRIADILYENKDVEQVVGDYTAPKNNKVIVFGYRDYSISLTDDDLKLGGNGKTVHNRGAINNHMQKYIDEDYYEISTKLANYLAGSSRRKPGIDKLMKIDSLPDLIPGIYPVRVSFKLPGKRIITSNYIINITLN